jgi:short subunit dehydrogenase-like uncharacterized protein
VSRSFDLVVFGATGFTGRLVAQYLAEHAPARVRVALAGRNLQKLQAVRAGLPGAASGWALLEADSGDAAALGRVVEQTAVVITTVGPYAKLGLPLVEACAKAGTHCVDLTGEPQFVRASIDRFDAAAKASGARIVHCCGFDSIPSDLGVWVLYEHLQQRGKGETLTTATLVIEASKGGFSGGTLASVLNILDDGQREPALRQVLTDPYGLSPDRAAEPDLGKQSLQLGLRFDRFLDRWTAPFPMEAINAQVVRRSNAVLGYAYGRALRYRETVGFARGVGGLVRAGAVTGVLGLGAALLANAATRAVLTRFLPKQGEGPSEETMRTGHFRARIFAETSRGERFNSLVVGRKDPGYGETAKMLSESALALVLDVERLPVRAGVLTPATAFGGVLRDRLVAAGMTFALEGALS